MKQLAQSGQKRTNRLTKLWNYMKETMLPASRGERTKRVAQIRDISIFVGSVAVFMIFEKKIRKMITIDQRELQKMSLQQQQMAHGF